MVAEVHECGERDVCRLWRKVIREKRFPMTAYEFVADTVAAVGRLKHREVTAEEVFVGIGVLAAIRYGVLRTSVFQTWKLLTRQDAEIVMRDLCDVGVLRRSGDRFECANSAIVAVIADWRQGDVQ